MPVETVAHTFPAHWSYGQYELSVLDRVAVMQMYHSMLPDLIHNRVRWYHWAQEQKQRLQTFFHDRP